MYLDTLLVEENLKNIIDGKSTVKEVAKILGMGYQSFSSGNVGIKDIYKTLGYTQDDIESLVEESMSPPEILIRGVEGEYYPVKRTNFDKVYEVI